MQFVDHGFLILRGVGASRWVGPGKIEVRQIILNGRHVFKVTRHGFLVEYCHSIHRLAELVDLANLTEVVDLPKRRKSP